MTNEQYEDLVLRVGRGFNEVNEKVDNGFKKVRKEFALVHREIDEVKLRQDNVAYRFEIDDHEKRIKQLEERDGLA